jgi:ATP-dependent DNA helicase RecG
MSRDDEAINALRAITEGKRPHDLESPTLDFKEEKRVADETIKLILQASLCFANANGGVIVIGVANKIAGGQAIVGCEIEADLLQRRIFELSRPPLTVDVRRETRFGRPLLFVYVPRSPDIHADPQGRAPRRVGTACLPMEPAEQSRLRDERAGFDWSAQPSSRGLADVSHAAMETARRRLGLSAKHRGLRRLSDPDILRALGLVADGRLLTRGGELLFCRLERSRVHLVYQYRATPGGEPRMVERIDPPLLAAFERTLELIRARLNTTPLTLPDGQQVQLQDFPELAVREAIANAIIHRDYHLAAPTQVEHSPEVLVVSSPGPLVSGVTPENILTHPSKPRNPSIANAFRILGLAEEVGRGVDRMYREMIRTGGRIPQIASGPDSVRVALVGGAPNTQIARFVAQLPQDERDDTDTMLVLFGLCSDRAVTAPDLAHVLQKTAEETEAVLRRLSSEPVAIVEPTRQTAHRGYPSYRLNGESLKALGSAVTYHRRTVDEIDRKVIAHVREYGKVTNRTVQNLLDVSLQRAKSILADLVRRSVLVKTSAHERGPGVEYGAGTKFPPSRGTKRSERSA